MFGSDKIDEENVKESNAVSNDESKEENNTCAQEPIEIRDMDEIQTKMKEAAEETQKYKDLYQRLLAEFDNYKKRTIKERETSRIDARIDVISKFLPVIDNIERAEKSFEADAVVDSLKQGIDMVYKQILDIMISEDVTCIEAEGEEFNPEYHNAVMHVEDDTCDTNIIIEEFQKGYKCKDKVIRYSMVKVAN